MKKIDQKDYVSTCPYYKQGGAFGHDTTTHQCMDFRDLINKVNEIIEAINKLTD